MNLDPSQIPSQSETSVEGLFGCTGAEVDEIPATAYHSKETFRKIGSS